ncbi:MAG TPA: hypothetical protein VG099_15875, partial [Gemmataceae bacterium]|nr:hypothetical protein [Gemmataceae bacterium]
MDAQELIAEAKKLVRPSLYLYAGKRDPAPVGVWRGDPVVPPPAPRRRRLSWQHWISVDCSWLAKHGFDVAGWLSVFEEVDQTEVKVDWWKDGDLIVEGYLYSLLSKKRKERCRFLKTEVQVEGSTGRYAAVLDRQAKLTRGNSNGTLLYGKERAS